MANVKFIAVSRGLRGIVDYVTNREKTVEQLISGVNCVARTAVPEFEAVKKQFRKTEGRGYYHIVQAFAPDDPLDFATAHELGVKLAEHFEGYQCIVVTHMNTAHIHDLRHTFATLSLKYGVDVKTLSGALGHYDAGFTLSTYTHATEGMKRSAADTIGSVISQTM